MANRVIYLVDGFNLYHSLKDAERDGPGTHTRWLDLPEFCRSTLHMFGQQRVALERVIYFSALAKHLEATKPDVTQRHQTYIQALQHHSVEVDLAQFKKKYFRCPDCGHRFMRHEEKESDVAIAIRLLEVLTQDECDAAVLVSGDTDVLPGIRAVKRLFPDKTIGVVFPYKRHNRELERAADCSIRIAQNQYAKFQLPDTIVTVAGTRIVKPGAW